ncbi:MAG TPA: hypothetical protein VL595_31475 [Pseudonocardia sp.]|jgi:hypothetical protein|nr:hypothetical protein [Pseudonocardia sp.]
MGIATDFRLVSPISPAKPIQPTATALGGQSMWMYEALVRSRLQETEREAQHRRMVRELTAGRLWRRVARFADRRAELARRGV